MFDGRRAVNVELDQSDWQFLCRNPLSQLFSTTEVAHARVNSVTSSGQVERRGQPDAGAGSGDQCNGVTHKPQGLGNRRVVFRRA